MRELAGSVGDVEHPLLRTSDARRTGPTASPSSSSPATAAWPARTTAASCARPTRFIREQEAAGKTVDLYVAGKKGVTFFNFQKRPITQRFDQFARPAAFADVEPDRRAISSTSSSTARSTRSTSRT